MARFFRRGVEKVYFVPSIASQAAPTTTEINAGSRLDTQIAANTGWKYKNNPITTPDLATTFDSKIAGPDSAEDSSFTLYEDKTSNPLETTLAKGTTGFVVIFQLGTAGANPASGEKCEVWPIVVTSMARNHSMGAEAATWVAEFAITATPSLMASVA